MEDDYPGFFEFSTDERWFKEEAIKFARRLKRKFCQMFQIQFMREYTLLLYIRALQSILLESF